MEKLTHSKIATILTACLVVAGCSDAKQATEVAPAIISPASYSHMSCRQLRAEARVIQESLPQLSNAVDKDYRRDKNMEAVTWILFWPALFAMDGNDEEVAALSGARGKINAIKEQMGQKNCRIS